MSIPLELEGVLVSTPDTLSGAVRFVGTRVHVQILFDHILMGKGVEDFLEGFPSVTREQAMAVLEFYRKPMAEATNLDLAS